MTRFISRYATQIKGFLSGFDRLVFRGTLRTLSYVEGMMGYLSVKSVLLRDFGAHARQVSEVLKAASLAPYEQAGLPVVYLTSPKTNKEEVARRLAAEHGITAGAICVLKCVEPCQTYRVYRNRETKQIELRPHRRQCLYFYHYLFHPTLGFMNARIQTWFPFSVQICLNGREWLSRQMDAANLGYQRADNCYAWVEDFAKAQELLDGQLHSDWPQLLGEIGHLLNPILSCLSTKVPAAYYWSTHQSEWATDIVFDDPRALERLYPKFLGHALSTLGSPDVLRFLGRRVTLSGAVPLSFGGEVTTDLKRRHEGVRIKHTVNGNSVKAYDKLYTAEVAVLRVESTINNAADFRVYRPKEGGPEEDLQWRSLRKGVADQYRRSQLSQRANERYLDALASADDSATLGDLLKRVTEPAQLNGRRVRALRPFEAADLALLQAISRGEFTIGGLRNGDLQEILFTDIPATPKERKRRSAWVTRRIRLLRAHGILHKVGNTRRYQLTKEGRRLATAVLTAHRTPVDRMAAEALPNAA